ncbi:DUF7504 family protein [Haladaptatus sp. NG-SE-30]
MPTGQAVDEVAYEFTRELQQLKRRGCNLLLVGSVPDSVLSTACRKFFGDPEERRYRVAVLSGTNRTAIGERLSTSGAPKTTTVITHATEVSSDSPVSSVHVDESVPELAGAISETITSFQTDGGLRSGELRLGLDSLETLFTRYEQTAVEQFLDNVTGQVRGANGMGHFVLPREYDHELVADVSTVFDGIVEYQVGDGGQERWHIPDRDLRSPWLPL